jgi:hypothetical protein
MPRWTRGLLLGLLACGGGEKAPRPDVMLVASGRMDGEIEPCG